jgi:hypothetical protein
MVSVISTIHVIDFFLLSNPNWLAVTLAIAFEVGAAASLASLVTLEKMNKGIVWGLFFILTAMQAMGNTYYTYIHIHDFQGWIELFGLTDEDPIYQKRILAITSGAILPLVALGFIKSLVDYIKPDNTKVEEPKQVEVSQPTFELKNNYDDVIKAGQDAQHAKIMEFVAKKAADREAAGETYEDEPTALANSGIRERAEAAEAEEEDPEKIEIIKVIDEYLAKEAQQPPIDNKDTTSSTDSRLARGAKY